MVRIKRVYELRDKGDGDRVLIDQLWPRGMSKEQLHYAWHRDVAPSPELRRWFNHEPERWEEFKKRYFAELDSRPEAWQPLLEKARHGDLTMLYSARETGHNNAVALKEYLESKLKEPAAV